MSGMLSHLPWNASKLARVKSWVLPGIRNDDASAVPAAVPMLAKGVPVVSGDSPRSGWKPFLAKSRSEARSFSFLSTVRLAITL